MIQNKFNQQNIIIGLSGHIGCGKDYIGCFILPEIINQYFSNIKIHFLSFADQLKIEFYSRNSVSFQNLFINKSCHIRQQLQQYGTEQCRKKYGDDIWIKALDCQIQLLQLKYGNYNNCFIITDVRFQNEYDFIINKINDINFQFNFVIRICSPNRTQKKINEELYELNNELKIIKENEIKNHISETQLDYLDYNLSNKIDNDEKNENNVLNDIKIIIQDVIHKQNQQIKN